MWLNGGLIKARFDFVRIREMPRRIQVADSSDQSPLVETSLAKSSLSEIIAGGQVGRPIPQTRFNRSVTKSVWFWPENSQSGKGK